MPDHARDKSSKRAAREDAPSGQGLQANALGLLSTAALTAAYMGPALSVYALFDPMSDLVGAGVGFVMLIALGLTLLSAISFGMLAKEMPSAGGAYAWTCAALGDSFGLWIGLITTVYYAICLVFPPIVFGDYLREVLAQLNLPSGHWTWLVGALLMVAAAGAIAYRGIVVSAHLACALLVVEVAVIVSLAATFIGSAIVHGTFTLAPITFSACQGGWSAVFLALPMAIISMACDAATPASEETRNAKWTIPVAVVLTCTIVGLWYMIGFSAFAMGRTTALATHTSASVAVPVMVASVWGSFRILVSLTAMSAALGAFIPGITAASRVIFAMARENKLPRWFARLHPRFRAPWNALHLLFVFTIVGSIPGAYLFGSTRTMEWWSFTLGWFVGIAYLAVNVVNTVYYWRFARARFHAVMNGLIPGIAIVVQLLIVWRTVVRELWNAGITGRSAQAFIVLVSCLSAIYVLFVRSRSAGPGGSALDAIAAEETP